MKTCLHLCLSISAFCSASVESSFAQNGNQAKQTIEVYPQPTIELVSVFGPPREPAAFELRRGRLHFTPIRRGFLSAPESTEPVVNSAFQTSGRVTYSAGDGPRLAQPEYSGNPYLADTYRAERFKQPVIGKGKQTINALLGTAASAYKSHLQTKP